MKEKLEELYEALDGQGENWAWMNGNAIDGAGVGDQFDQVRWEVEWEGRPEVSDIVGIQFYGEKLGDDQQFFDIIAPLVEPDSYIQMSGEDSDMWRWVFNGDTCQEVYPEVSWNG